MVKEELRNYVRENLEKGFSREKISVLLKESGYDDLEIEEAFSNIQSKPKKKIWGKKSEIGKKIPAKNKKTIVKIVALIIILIIIMVSVVPIYRYLSLYIGPDDMAISSELASDFGMTDDMINIIYARGCGLEGEAAFINYAHIQKVDGKIVASCKYGDIYQEIRDSKYFLPDEIIYAGIILECREPIATELDYALKNDVSSCSVRGMDNTIPDLDDYFFVSFLCDSYDSKEEPPEINPATISRESCERPSKTSMRYLRYNFVLDTNTKEIYT